MNTRHRFVWRADVILASCGGVQTPSLFEGVWYDASRFTGETTTHVRFYFIYLYRRNSNEQCACYTTVDAVCSGNRWTLIMVASTVPLK